MKKFVSNTIIVTPYINGQMIQMKNQSGNIAFKWPIRPDPSESIFKCTWNIPQDRSHAGYKTGLSKFKKIEITSSIFSDRNTFETRNQLQRKKLQKNTNTWRLNNM